MLSPTVNVGNKYSRQCVLREISPEIWLVNGMFDGVTLAVGVRDFIAGDFLSFCVSKTAFVGRGLVLSSKDRFCYQITAFIIGKLLH